MSVGKPASLRVQLVDARSGKPVRFESARFAVAVYNQGPQSVVVDPRTSKAVVALPDVVENHGYNYRIAGVTSRPSGEPLPAVTTPVGKPFLVTFGSGGMNGVTDASILPEVRLSGVDASDSISGENGWTTVGQPTRGAGTVKLVRTGPKPETGVDFIAIYTPAS